MNLDACAPVHKGHPVDERWIAGARVRAKKNLPRDDCDKKKARPVRAMVAHAFDPVNESLYLDS
jgi:hypothetical protein